VCFTDASVTFVKQQPPHYIEFVVLVKARILDNVVKFDVLVAGGSKTSVSMREHAHAQGVTSYLMELLAIRAVQLAEAAAVAQTAVTQTAREATSSSSGNTTQAAAALKGTGLTGASGDAAVSMTECFGELHRLVSNFASRRVVFKEQGDRFQAHYTTAALKKFGTPLVLDPANPTNNVAAELTELGKLMLKKACNPTFALARVSCARKRTVVTYKDYRSHIAILSYSTCTSAQYDSGHLQLQLYQLVLLTKIMYLMHC
jgi:2'-5'-oligoadenylate synthetase 1, domain 2, C-terminus